VTTFTSYNVISAYKCRNGRGFSHHPGWQPEWCCQLAGHVLFFFSTEKSCVFKLDMSVKVFGTIDTEYLGKHCLGEFIHMNHMKSYEWLVGFAILLNRKSKVYRYDCMSKPVLTHLQVKQIECYMRKQHARFSVIAVCLWLWIYTYIVRQVMREYMSKLCASGLMAGIPSVLVDTDTIECRKAPRLICIDSAAWEACSRHHFFYR